MTRVVRKRGATPNKRRRPLTKLPGKHLLMASGAIVAVLGIVSLLPAPEVEAKRNAGPDIVDEQSESSSTSSQKPHESSPFNETSTEKSVAAIVPEKVPAEIIHKVTVKPGDSLSLLFNRKNLSPTTAYKIAQTPKWGKALTRIQPRETLVFTLNQSGELIQLRYSLSKLESIVFTVKGDKFTARHILREPQTRLAYSTGTIENSLFLASQKAGLTNRLTMELASIFGWDIDFVQDIREGDHFTVMYEEKFLDDEKLGNGSIVAATFTNQGKTFTAIRYTDSNNVSNYYTPDGKSMKKAFLRTPVEFTRISSRFDPGRLHPIFKTKRPHRAVDYAAPMNTPIKASGDGKVKFAGWQNGYGNVVYLQHPNNIVTVYAHQNRIRKGLKVGQRVSQGQVIGYVGQTGWATGPHLHYEFRVNGVHRNPMTVKLPNSAPISNKEMVHFKQQVKTSVARLEKASGTMLAKGENTQ
ncbi:Murein DD-endopeptidase MepM [invertebrate metagenome]|uniref:Murein DD-endopeptidase MepM n=1 Tax=invertebrate metagenome TaxID=1711999 RepID=A0A2H9TCG3_9ZZZZ